MIGIDTNILVRYLTQDDPAQASIATKLLETYSGQKNSLFINNIVLCELVWVLERGYKYKKSEIVQALKILLQTPEFSFQDHTIIAKATIEYERINNSDLSDIIISLTNNNEGAQITYSFDNQAVEAGYFKLPE
jgi:predicted nucleic-acid-binding protein